MTTRSSGWLLLLVLLARAAGAAPYTAPTITGRAIPSCLGAGNPIPCCTANGVGNCILDTDFTAHTQGLERVDAIVRSDITEAANLLLAGPTTGAAAAPAWRAFVLADLPETIKTGTGGSFVVMSAAENPTNGCATWASGILGTTSTACGSGGGGITTVKEDTVNFTATATAIDFTEPDATGLIAGTASTPTVAMSKYTLLAGRSGGQILDGGTAAGDVLTLSPTSATPDASTGFLAGAAINQTEPGKMVTTWLSRGNQTIAGTFHQLTANDGKAPHPLPGDDTTTFNMTAGTCTASAAMNTDCDAVDKPWDCCTGAGTGACGYCNGAPGTASIPIDCDTGGSNQCPPAFAILSHWWDVFNYQADGHVIESNLGIVLGPTITGSGGGTRSVGGQGFLDWVPVYQIPVGTNLAASRVDHFLVTPSFTRVAGSSATGTVPRVAALNISGNVSAGWTITDWLGITMAAPTNAGSIGDVGVIDVADLSTAGATADTFAVRSAINSGTGKYFLKHTGTAQSLFGGKVRMAADTTSPTAQLEVKSAANLSNTATINTTGVQTGIVTLLALGSDNVSLGASGTFTSINGQPTITLSGDTGVFGAGNFIVNQPVWQTDGTGRTMSGAGTYVALPTFASNSAALTMNASAVTSRAATGAVASPNFSRPSGTSTQTAASWTGFLSGTPITTNQNAVGDGWTVTDWRGFEFNQPAKPGSGTGVITNLVALDIGDMTVGTTSNTGIRSAVSAGASRSFISHTGTARSNFGGPVRLAADSNVPAAGTMLEVQSAANVTNAATINMAGSQTGITSLLNLGNAGVTLGASGQFNGIDTEPTLTVAGAASIFGGANFIFVKPTIQNDGATRDIDGVNFYSALPTFASNGAAFSLDASLLTGRAAIGYSASPVFSRPSSNLTQTAHSWTGFQAGTTNTGLNALKSGWTLTTMRGFEYNQPAVVANSNCTASTVPNACCTGTGTGSGTGDCAAGTITTQIAMDIPTLSVGATNIGVRNAATTVNTPSTIQTIASGGTITCNATTVMVQSTGSQAGSTTTSVTDGVDGQLCTIIDADADADIFTMDTQGSNLRGSQATFAMGTGDTITLLFSATLADWVEVARSNNT